MGLALNARSADGSWQRNEGCPGLLFWEDSVHKYLFVGIGGFCGAISRYAVDGYVKNVFGLGFPVGTLVVNASGSFLLGLVFAAVLDGLTHDHALTLLIASGFIGAYTTFSTFMLDSAHLANDGGVGLAVGNIGLSLALGLAAVYLGLMLGKGLAGS